MVKQKESERETPARKEKRQEPAVRHSETARETPRRQAKRTPDLNVWESIEKFKEEIQHGPTYICTCCNRLLRKTAVVLYTEKKFSEQADLMEKCRSSTFSADGKEYICSTCKACILKGDVPALAVVNGLQLDEVPQTLADLNELESTFVARRIQFMKLLALPRGKQKAVHGCVVNVPVEPEKAVSILPRVSSPETMIPVKLKRKLQYRGHSIMQNIRPKAITDALYMLKYTLKNSLYEDVHINEHWIDDSQQEDPELWHALTGQPDVVNASRNGSVESDNGEHDDDAEENTEDERSHLSGLPFDTCLQPKDVSPSSNLILSVAPGEGKKPQVMKMDPYSEEMSFPCLFPTGQFGYSHKRQKNVSLKKYFQSRMLHCDGRFARNIQYLFYAQYRCEAKEIKDGLSVALRKGKGTDITAKDVKEKISDVIRNDLGYHFLQKIRGSPAFFNKLLLDLLGMIRQLGPCTWFITLSAADLKWTDTIRIIARQQGQILSDDEIERMSWEERCLLLRSNPVTAAMHFDDRVQHFMKMVLLNKKLNPLGCILDYRYRVEFQQRDSPHIHMVAWVRDAPTFESNSEEEIKHFVDQYLTCSLPLDDDHLHKLLTTVQRHTHSVACRKHGETCRFQFPRPPVRETLAVKPSDPPTPEMEELYHKTLSAVQKQMEDDMTDVSFEQLLNKAQVIVKLYIHH